MNSIENSFPVYLQIKEKIAILIFGGKLRSGDKLPTVREIALSERVNPNTVQRALAELEREGLIFNKSTSGNYVTDDFELIMRKREEYARELTRNYERKMRQVNAEIVLPKVFVRPMHPKPKDGREIFKKKYRSEDVTGM